MGDSYARRMLVDLRPVQRRITTARSGSFINLQSVYPRREHFGRRWWYRDAEVAYRKAIASSEDSALASLNMGNALHEEGAKKEAAYRYTQAAEAATTKEKDMLLCTTWATI